MKHTKSKKSNSKYGEVQNLSKGSISKMEYNDQPGMQILPKIKNEVMSKLCFADLLDFNFQRIVEDDPIQIKTKHMTIYYKITPTNQIIKVVLDIDKNIHDVQIMNIENAKYDFIVEVFQNEISVCDIAELFGEV